MKKNGSSRIAACAILMGAALLIPEALAATIIINQLDDMPMGTWSGSGDMAQTMNH